MQLFEKYGTLIERYTALIEKVSALIGLPHWNWLSDCNVAPPSQLEPNTTHGVLVPSASLEDFILGGMHAVAVTPDGRSSGTALRSSLDGNQGGATFTSRYAIHCGGALVAPVRGAFVFSAMCACVQCLLTVSGSL
eukprot:SAG31_NODE_8153_length_1508_cov_1.898510_1_plen_136_part_00